MNSPAKDRPEKYPASLRLLHWAMAFAFILLFISGYIMVDLDKKDPLRPDLFGVHKSIGVIIIVLLAFRLTVRLRSILPELPSSLQQWETSLAHWGHRLLYLLMIVTPFVGYADSNLHGRAVKLFGLPLPKLFPTVEGVGSTPGDVHTVLAYTLLGIVAIHIAAVIKHRFVDRADVLPRIT
jgi:cytochrome b561